MGTDGQARNAKLPKRKTARVRRTSAAVTIDSVAERAGVAPATVSRALNHPGKVAAATLARVNLAIAETGYLPNLLAGALATSRSRLFAAIVPSIANAVYAETIQSFTRTVREHGYQVVLGESGYDHETEDAVVAALLGRRPDAVFLIGINHSLECRRRLLAAKIPLVETWDITPTPLDIVVGYSHDQVGTAVAEFLLGRGHTRFAAICGDDSRAHKRVRAFSAEIAKRGGGEVPVETAPPGSSLQWGRHCMASLLDRGFADGAVFCSSDVLALGVMVEAQSRGLKIPADLAVVGFGDLELAAHTFPALSTVRVDRTLMGARAAEALLARVADRPFPETVIDLGFSIVSRETA
jgi:LacI family transcriptional regulator, gluconate utilization system Gnt-I transcriptional repressor